MQEQIEAGGTYKHDGVHDGIKSLREGARKVGHVITVPHHEAWSDPNPERYRINGKLVPKPNLADTDAGPAFAGEHIGTVIQTHTEWDIVLLHHTYHEKGLEFKQHCLNEHMNVKLAGDATYVKQNPNIPDDFTLELDPRSLKFKLSPKATIRLSEPAKVWRDCRSKFRASHTPDSITKLILGYRMYNEWVMTHPTLRPYMDLGPCTWFTIERSPLRD